MKKFQKHTPSKQFLDRKDDYAGVYMDDYAGVYIGL